MMNIINKIKDKHSVSDIEGRLLYNLASKVSSSHTIVEIGSWRGVSTIWLGMGSIIGNHANIYAIDPHTGADIHKLEYGAVDTYQEFINNIETAGVDNIIHPYKYTSSEANRLWRGDPIGLLWIDGDHKQVAKDVMMWVKYLVNGGILVLHDTTTWKHPNDVALLLYKHPNYKDIKHLGSITYAVKCDKRTIIDNVLANIAYIKRLIYQLLLPAKNKIYDIGKRIIANGK